MKWLRYLSIWLCAVSVGCTSDGGPAGTGISTTSAISGNVVDVGSGTAAAIGPSAPTTQLPPIQVSIDELPDVTTMVDSAGNFALSGNFPESVTLRFKVPEFQVFQPLDVPAGSAVVLQNIELQPDGIVIQAARQLHFFGTVDAIDCTDGTLRVHERQGNGRQFLVYLDDQTSFVDASGQSQTCTAVRMGSTIAVEGSIAYSTDRRITALVITIAARPTSGPPPLLEAPFFGTIAAVDCQEGFVVIDDPMQTTNLQLTAATRIADASGALTCFDLHLGDRVRGEGQINLLMPGVIAATKIVITGPPNLGSTLRFGGLIITIECADGIVQVLDDANAFDVQLSSMTVIARKSGQTLGCSDLQPGDRVVGVGRIVPGAPGTLDALSITLTQRRSGAISGWQGEP